MLSVNQYKQSYIDECRSRVKAQLIAYKNMAYSVKNQNAVNTHIESAMDSFEPVFFNNMVLVLDNYFSHRSRNLELKDGNPLNEVSLLSHSMLNNKNRFTIDKTIHYSPDKSVLKYKEGDEIRLREADFLKLFKAFFEEIENKYL